MRPLGNNITRYKKIWSYIYINIYLKTYMSGGSKRVTSGAATPMGEVGLNILSAKLTITLRVSFTYKQ